MARGLLAVLLVVDDEKDGGEELPGGVRPPDGLLLVLGLDVVNEGAHISKPRNAGI